MTDVTALDPRAYPRPADISHAIQSSGEVEWSPQQMDFQLWLATPRGSRDYSTQAEYAQANLISEATLSRWKAQPGFGDAVYDLARRLLKADKLSQVVNAQADLAESGLPFASTQAAQFVATAMGVMPRAGGDVNVNVQTVVTREPTLPD